MTDLTPEEREVLHLAGNIWQKAPFRWIALDRGYDAALGRHYYEPIRLRPLFNPIQTFPLVSQFKGTRWEWLTTVAQSVCGKLTGHHLSPTEFGGGMGSGYVDRWCRWCDKMVTVPADEEPAAKDRLYPFFEGEL